MTFQLTSDLNPAGDQPRAIAELTAGLVRRAVAVSSKAPLTSGPTVAETE